MLRCDLHGISLAAGSSCVNKALRASYVLTAIGLPPALAQSAVLLSLGQENTEAEVDYFVETFAESVVKKLRSLSRAWDEFQHGRLASQIPDVRAKPSSRAGSVPSIDKSGGAGRGRMATFGGQGGLPVLMTAASLSRGKV